MNFKNQSATIYVLSGTFSSNELLVVLRGVGFQKISNRLPGHKINHVIYKRDRSNVNILFGQSYPPLKM